MTTKPIETDRELDAEIAEKVMGWKHWRGRAGVFFLSPAVIESNSRARDYIREGIFTEVESGNEENAPHFSSEIAAAMQVVEKMQGEGFVVLMRNVNKWYVEFSPKTLNSDQHFGRTQHASLPMAICLAAREAVKGE